MAAKLEVVVDLAVGGEEALRMMPWLETLHLSLSSSRWLVRHLGAIVEISALTVLDARQDHALCGSVALELVRHDARGTYRKPFSGLRKNRLAAVALRRLWTRMSRTFPSRSSARQR
jgi:hypothetical protein